MAGEALLLKPALVSSLALQYCALATCHNDEPMILFDRLRMGIFGFQLPAVVYVRVYGCIVGLLVLYLC